MAAPISRLLIHAPLMPRTASEDRDFAACTEQFAWYLDGPVVSQGAGSIASMPYADAAYIFLPTIDVRLISLTVPLISHKKLQVVLSTLLEDQLLSTQEIHPQILMPSVGQAASIRTIAVMNQGWFEWLGNQLQSLLTPSIVVLADCFVLPPPTPDGVPSTFLDIISERPTTVMQVQRTGLQTGLAWLEEVEPHRIEKNTLTWDWQWVREAPLSDAIANTKLILTLPKRRRKPTENVSGSARGFIQKTVPWLNATLGVAFFSYLLYGLSLIFLNWKWQEDLQSLARRALQTTPNSTLTAIAGGPQPISQLISLASRIQQRQGQLGQDDFLSLAAQLQQLRTQLPQDAIAEIDYQGYDFIVRFRAGVDAALIMHQAHALGIALTPIGNERYRLLAYAGLSDSKALQKQGKLQ